ncbi:DUF3987 domain-containing protein [Algoriphagus pacificus]|uniref:DUF3987 domain-containing protein n=1 Tax=Algoriphagus pacificus TaxID=2811234 RepID=A0ABS3CKT9_9BACT|nr:DUF3987 domain-containing protein [Algoriphagus pacificus]MBN7816850.1 DUF3987 domain-containing protein [Algoriphagus pacificus]
MKKTFNPQDWIENPSQQQINTEPKENTPQPNLSDVEQIIQQIEANQIDIATAYSDWRNIGFAFADEFGESGRDYFHRISRFYADYSANDCDRQFDNCLKAKGQGISLKTFFYHAKQAGIPISKEKVKKEEPPQTLPNLPDTIFPELPELLQQVTEVATSKEERDLLLLGSLVAISACLPKFFGKYDGRKVFANLFLFVTAQASAGKGRMVLCRQLVQPIHKELREQAKMLKQQYELELAEYNAKKGKEEGVEKPGKPPEKMLFIPANNSSTGAYQLLNDSDGKGLIFETEGDTLSQAFKSDYGNYSEGFRKAFHHETISYYRRTDREMVDIESPCLSAVLSGTPKQISALIPNAENGLFSRFIFYFMNVRTNWKDVFADATENGLDDHFDALGARFYELFKILKSGSEIEFCLTAEQKNQFNQFFAQVQDQYIALQGLDYMATVRRMGLVAFRISMIFTALRILETGDTSSQMVCEERDFQAAISMVKVLVKHSSKVFNELPEDEKPPSRKNRKQKFLEALPKNFNRQKYLEVAKALNVADKTAEGYITEFAKKGLIHREMQDHYINLSVDDNPTPTN